MVYLYIDESGDLGFSAKGSKYFIFTCVKIEDDKTNTLFKRIPKQVRQRTLNKKYKKQSELKFSNSSALIRERFLTRTAKLDVSIYSLIIEKKYTKQKLKENLPVLYNYLIKILLETIIEKNHKINICLDKCMSPSQRENFGNYIRTEFFFRFKEMPHLSIIHENSHCNEALQVLDFICGAFGYKYNTRNMIDDFDRYTKIIKDRIIEERYSFFKEK